MIEVFKEKEIMNCKDIEPLLPAYHEKSLANDIQNEISAHLGSCRSCKNEFDKLTELDYKINSVIDQNVPKKVDDAFAKMLEDERKGIKPRLSTKLNQKQISLSLLLRYAAGVLLLITGGVIGYNLHPSAESSTEVAGLKQEMVEMKNLVIYSLIKQESASERIKAVSYIKEIPNADPKLIETLFNTLNKDRNVNVRLAAAQALAKYKDNKEVAKGIIKSLEKQTEPLLQIMLINLAVETGDSEVGPELNKMIQRTDLMDEVKNYAKKGIKTISI